MRDIPRSLCRYLLAILASTFLGWLVAEDWHIPNVVSLFYDSQRILLFYFLSLSPPLPLYIRFLQISRVSVCLLFILPRADRYFWNTQKTTIAHDDDAALLSPALLPFPVYCFTLILPVRTLTTRERMVKKWNGFKEAREREVYARVHVAWHASPFERESPIENHRFYRCNIRKPLRSNFYEICWSC